MPALPEETASTVNTRPTAFRIATVSIVLAAALAAALLWRRGPTTNTSDPYAAVPFRPKVTYDSSSVAVTNTEEEPYLETSLNVYVGATLYRAQVGTIRPGETVTRPLRGLTDGRGRSFEPGSPRTSELEVRARFRGHDVHRDFPPPP
jgi:hypothetical protein